MAKLINLKIFKRFFQSSSAAGILLLLCVAISLTIANTGTAGSFQNFLSTKIGLETSLFSVRYSVITWINDGLMAIFFLLVGLEIKREVLEGELSTFRQASLPVLAAIGGAIVPALIYSGFNAGTATAGGWGIPMATDIAFALGILSLLGNRVPTGLKIFLAALAIVDDLIAILVIAVFYSSDLHLIYLGYAALLFALQLAFNRMGIKNILFYIVPAIVMWYFIHHSGIHATIAGVLTAMTLPTNETDEDSPLEKLEHLLAQPVNFIIMPIFAIANTNITIQGSIAEGIFSGLGMGILLGLVLGKPIGILLLSWLSVKLKIADLPAGTNWLHIAGLGLLGGIGFTMSIFIGLLSFNSAILQNEAKFVILIASFVSGILGYLFLRGVSGKEALEKLN